ncbi:MAG: hypothetical protein ACR2FY_08725 [Pirellulaceae bacterium]
MIFAFVAGAIVIAIALVEVGLLQKPPAKTELDAALERTKAILLRGDPQALKDSCTDAGWKRINKCYDFHLGTQGFRGTFGEFMQECGRAMNSSKPGDVVKTNLDSRTVVFFFDRSSPEGVTIAFCNEQGRWEIAYLSPGEIEPSAIFANPPNR